jgi:peptide/nickel transport system permease protein
MNIYLIVRKVVQVIALVLIMAVILYVIFRLMPGNPAELFLAGAKSKDTSPEALHDLESQLGLVGGKWNYQGFIKYMEDVLTLNFGYDYYRDTTVWQLITSAIPYTLILIGSATVLSYVVGLPLGIVSIWLRGKRSEGGIVTGGLILNSIPYFILAIVLYLYFVLYFRLEPVRSVFPISDITHPSLANFGFVVAALTLPLATLALIFAAGNLLTMRAAMVSVLGEDFILTARAKGVKDSSIMFRHAARNAMIPVSTRMALDFATVASGAVITEIIYSIPGIGNLTYQAILTLDYPLAEGALFFLALIVIFAYSAVDFIHAWLDPRIQL